MPFWMRCLFGVVAVLISAVALSSNAKFYATAYATDAASQKIFMAIALVSAAVKLTFPAGLAHVSGHNGVKFFGWLVVVCCVIFDTFGALGYMQQTRGATIEARLYDANSRESLAAEVERLRGLADAAAGPRATAVIEAELNAARPLAKNCKARPHLDACKDVSRLEIELAAARERDSREAAFELRKQELSNLGPIKTAPDPQAAVFGKSAARDAGFFMGILFSVLIIIIFEVTPPVAAFLALYKPRAPVKPLEPPRGKLPAGPPPNEPPRPSGDALEALRALLATGAPGIVADATAATLTGAQRALAAALGVNVTKLNRDLAALVAAGSVEKRSGPGGTVLRIN